MQCRRTRKLIPFLAQGELTPGQRQEVQEHLRSCSRCSAVASEYDRLARLARSAREVQVAPGFYERFSARLDDERHRTAVRSPRASLRRPPLLRPRYAIAATVALTIMACVLVVATHSFFDPTGRRLTLSTYLQRADFRGLKQALEDERRRDLLMADSVSVDLLIEAVDRLHRSSVRRGQVGVSVAECLESIRADAVASEPESAAKGSGSTAVGNEWLSSEEIDFNAVLRALNRLRISTDKVTLRELAETAALLPKS